jgi:hypothetical protein
MESDRSAAVTDAWDRGTAAVQRGEVRWRCATTNTRSAWRQRCRDHPGDRCARLSLHDPRAAEAFVATRDDVQEAWLGLAAHITAWVSTFSPGKICAALAPRPCPRHRQYRSHDTITLACHGAGWCALSADGKRASLFLDPAADMNRIVILLDGEPPVARRRQCTRDGERRRLLWPAERLA